MTTLVVVERTNLGNVEPRHLESVPLADGQVRLSVDLFGVTSNNITYGLYGDVLDYWSFFPVDEVRGCIPVWGFGDVVESHSAHVDVGERLFGYFPMGDELVIAPSATDEAVVEDASPHRAHLNPWYNRYYRCASDPVWTAETEPLQAVMWALFMTGWVLAHDIDQSMSTVVVSSASSKTSLSMAWTLHHDRPDVEVIGLTSQRNVEIVEALGVYDRVVAYDDIDTQLASNSVAGPVTLVDAAGNMDIKSRVHRVLGDRLVDSRGLGATHQRLARSAADLVGPTPRRFFIPDVADEVAAHIGFNSFHRRFAGAWHRFAPWALSHLTMQESAGLDAILSAYATTLAGAVSPDTALVLRWQAT